MIKEHQAAIVTGQSQGFGVYIAKALAKEGMKLVLAARNASRLDNIANEIKASGVQIVARDCHEVLRVKVSMTGKFILNIGQTLVCECES